MRQLQTCDFCGADPVGVYEPLPARLAADQPRVALCGDCRDTLQRVLAPLDGVDAGHGGAASDDAGAGDANGVGDASDAGTAAAADAPGTAASADEPVGATAGGDGPAEGAAPSSDEVDLSPDETVAVDAPDVGEGDVSGSAGGTDASAADAGADDGVFGTVNRPPGYGNVLRLVRNRDEPLAREELQTVVSSAYDLSESAVERAVDAAVENGDLRKVDGGLRRT